VTGFVSSPLFSYVTAARGGLTAGRAMTLTSAMYNLGAVIGPISGGWIGEQFSLADHFPLFRCRFYGINCPGYVPQTAAARSARRAKQPPYPVG
jgi:MFS family permease